MAEHQGLYDWYAWERLEFLVNEMNKWLADAVRLDLAISQTDHFKPHVAKKLIDNINRHWQESVSSAARVLQGYAVLDPFGPLGESETVPRREFKKFLLQQLRCRTEVLDYFADAEVESDGQYADIDDDIQRIGQQVKNLSELLVRCHIETESSQPDSLDPHNDTVALSTVD